ncbi:MULTISPECIES: ATP phosphoribosyltransferase [Thermotoga]|uniref:ATP phosphoribosyltransferase n=1 Tax=Thermotoga neapolitana (strain ATCC 49049 / DSM 4359 / NBRC 107923 / NS-E) TaxID=309803 RepID=HIS1_THENN|nr:MULTISPECIES: ATP phosphoribosyltransferase [Thermotoga]B9K9R7.1 RecName: Full=ATP phosphoribosyltransferase; Short=ATP-PRT; Short=ATP-PRTase [Thermotoga neapolitana DSM 4359]MDK2785695.1 phosphoribosyltransferase [Thermotoga sp.]HBF10235.1 ATP phosphoribosyltransferase [Thermotoga neapolitana]ACM23700.1 ATP phosphoribosyltransferase [Thermotoga neapolitana DSM 4359]AJG41600.1 ATP phosphoribosyltransferase [Thermotoga sp. RQ7]MDK2950021.1 phosphoribosyltransferase [Thermotoga sp.]
MLKLAIPKGRLEEKVMELLKKAGYTFQKESSILREGEDVTCFMVRPFDVPTYLTYGVADIGFCGTDVLLEKETSLIQPFFIPTNVSRMVLAGPKGKKIPEGEKRIATKFPNITRRYCESRGWHCKIIPLKGSVELAPIAGLSDLIVDITETGRTLRENDLEVLDEIFIIRTHVVVNPVSYRTKREEVISFLEKLQEVMKNDNHEKSHR